MKIAIASGKGGTGKTTLAVNLASFLADSGPVTLVDLDVEEPNSGLFLTGDPVHEEDLNKMVPRWEAATCSHCGQCQAVCNFNAMLSLPDQVMIFPELCHGCYACSGLCPTGSLPMHPVPVGALRHLRGEGIDFIEGKLKIGEEQAVPVIAQTLAYAEQQTPVDRLLLLDSPPGTSCPMIEVTRQADLVLLVTEPTPFGLHDLKLAVDTVRHLDREFAVVLNRFGIGDEKVETYCRDEGISIWARIPNSRAIAETYAAGRMIHREVPEVARVLQTVADRIGALQTGGLA